MSSPISIVFISDDKYVMNTAVAIASLKYNRNLNVEYFVYLIFNGISEETIKEIQLLEDEKFTIICMKYGQNTDEFARKDMYVSSIALAKFFLADILKHLDKVLYIDGDAIIQKDLVDLYNIDLEDNYAAVVRDILAEQTHPSILTKLHSDLEAYFNSGVMLLNLKKIREDDLSKKLYDYKKYGINYFMDQDALNVVFGRKVRYLPCKYNYMTTLSGAIEEKNIPVDFDFDENKTEIERLKEAHIVHFTGKEKPWNIYVPYATDVFMKYYRMCGAVKYKKLNIQKKAVEYEHYLFPFELVEKGSRIAIWGAGKVGRKYYEQVKYSNYCDVVLWVDEGFGELNSHLKEVVSPKKIEKVKLDYIVIAIKSEIMMKEIKKEIRQLQGNCDNVVWRHPVIK